MVNVRKKDKKPAAGKKAGTATKKPAVATDAAATTVPTVVDDIFGFPDQTDSPVDRCGLWKKPLVGQVYFRDWRMPAQFFAPNVRGLCKIPHLFVCDGCGRDFTTDVEYRAHAMRCGRALVGTEVYRDLDAGIVVTLAPGADEECGPACQRFSIFAKHFLDHKEAFLDVESFDYFLLYQLGPTAPEAARLRARDEARRAAPARALSLSSSASSTYAWSDDTDDAATASGSDHDAEDPCGTFEDGMEAVGPPRAQLHFAGFFSRDRQPQCLANLACIAVLPPYQSLGYGGLLVQLSYEVGRREGRWGSPERPITRQGRAAYTAAWCRMVSTAIVGHASGPPAAGAPPAVPSITGLAQELGMLPSDVLATLLFLGALREEAVTPAEGAGQPFIVITPEVERWAARRPRLPLDPALLHY